jgi:hypothetical protein
MRRNLQPFRYAAADDSADWYVREPSTEYGGNALKTQRLAALTGSVILAVTGVSAAAATPAVASSYKCAKATTIKQSWGQVVYTRCWAQGGSQTWAYVSGKLTDLNKSDDCFVRVTFKFQSTVVEFNARDQVTKFETNPKHANTFSASLKRFC